MKKYIWKLNKKNLSEANLTLYTKFIEKKQYGNYAYYVSVKKLIT